MPMFGSILPLPYEILPQFCHEVFLGSNLLVPLQYTFNLTLTYVESERKLVSIWLIKTDKVLLYQKEASSTCYQDLNFRSYDLWSSFLAFQLLHWNISQPFCHLCW